MNQLPLTNSQRQIVWYWLPSFAAALITGAAFITLGHTPVVRALALAATVAGVAASLRRFGAALAVIGGLAFAFSPAFWSQTGGGDSSAFIMIALFLVIATVVVMLLVFLGRGPSLAIGIGLIIFALLFWGLIGTPRSLRITTLMSAWLIYLLIDSLLTANPRAEDPLPTPLKTYQIGGILLLFTLGVLNDPLFTLFAPAVILTLVLAKTRLPLWYWGGIALVTLIGARGIAIAYLDSGWWLFPAGQAEDLNIRVPYVMADGWREASRWVYLFRLVIGQFSVAGILLGVFGLARLARWYPPLGTVTLTAYATYAIFGLVYFGQDSLVLLLPLLMLQTAWMTYAVHSFSHWLQKSFSPRGAARWLAPAAFIVLPVIMLFRIAGVI